MDQDHGTDKQRGWRVVSGAETCDRQAGELAGQHGDVVWKIDYPAGSYALQILRPASMAGRDDLKARLAGASSHDLFEIVEAMRLKT